MRKTAFLSILVLTTNLYANISQIPLYPSGISVEFKTPKKIIPQIEALEDNSKAKKSKLRKLKKKKEQQVEENLSKKSVETSTEFEKFSRFIRVINSTDNVEEDLQVALIFFDTNNNIIEKNIITNTVKPSPKYIFFMDRQTGRSFKGKLDIYYIPEDASSLSVAILDEDNNIIKQTTHPGYNKDHQIKISDYNKIGGNNKVMLQFEILGSSNTLLTRIAAFKF